MDTIFAPSHDWLDTTMQARQVKLDARALAEQFVAAVEFGACINAPHSELPDLVTEINMAANEQAVARYEDFDDMREYAKTQWQVMSQVIDIVNNRDKIEDPFGRIIDLIRDEQKCNREFRTMTLYMPDVVANNAN